MVFVSEAFDGEIAHVLAFVDVEVHYLTIKAEKTLGFWIYGDGTLMNRYTATFVIWTWSIAALATILDFVEWRRALGFKLGTAAGFFDDWLAFDNGWGR